MTWVDLEPVTRAQCAIVTGPPSSSPPMSLHVTINVGSSSDLGNVYVCGFGGFLFHPGVNAIPWPHLLSQPDLLSEEEEEEEVHQVKREDQAKEWR